MEEEAKQSILSPSFRSAAAMAGWDEDALLFATLVVEDTPVRESQRKKRLGQNLKSPLTSSSSSISRKRRSRRQLADPIPAVVLYRDDDNEFSSHKEVEVMEKESDGFAPNEEKKCDKGEVSAGKEGGKGLPCMDRLREELSCAICLEICYEPSTTPCGHSFCKKCLKNAANKCGKTCPKCRELISNGRLGTVNTVLWNTIQLLFPEEVEARKKAVILNSSIRKDIASFGSKVERIPSNRTRNFHSSNRTRNFHSSNRSSSSSMFRNAMEVLGVAEGQRSTRRRYNRGFGSHFEDAALALRLQREEFLEAFRNSRG